MNEAILTALPLDFFQLRVLMWKDRETYVGQCLETGNVATADDIDTLKSIVAELLADEVNYHINDRGTTSNLFSCPANRERWAQYYELSRNRNADLVGGINMFDATFG